MGFSFDRIRESVLALYTHCEKGEGFDMEKHKAGINDWLLFRRKVISRHLKLYTDAIRETTPYIRTGMYIFPPSLSILVGQSYGDLAKVFDFLSPMIYRRYEAEVGTACLDHEIMALWLLVNALDEKQKKPILSLYENLTGLPFTGGAPGIGELRQNGCPVSYTENEIKKAADSTGNNKKIIPIFMLKDHYLKQILEYCPQNGIEETDFFLYEKESMSVFEAII